MLTSEIPVASTKEKNGLCNVKTKDSINSPNNEYALYLLGIKNSILSL